MDQFGTGAVKDTPDPRDFIAEMPLGAVVMDFSKEFRLPEPPLFDQKASDCCVACAWAYYKWQITGGKKTFSKRDLFCRIALAYGAEIRAGGLEIVKNGIADNKEVKDPTSPTMANMRSTTGINPNFRVDDREFELKLLQDQTIHGVAWGIANYKGVVFGVVGSNEGWKDKLNPRPPHFGEKVWGHAIYGFGYHLHDGVECIIAKSSWKSSNEHHIKKDYFQAIDMTFNAWVFVQKGNLDTMKLIKENGTVYLQAGVNEKVKLGIADEATLALFGDEPVIDGVAEGTEYTISNGFIIHKK